MTTATMPLESLVRHVSPAVIYRHAPLEPSRNAMELWRPAVGQFVKPDDENDLWGELIYGSSELGEDTAFLAAGEGDHVRADAGTELRGPATALPGHRSRTGPVSRGPQPR